MPSRRPPPVTARELIYYGERKLKRSGVFYGHGTREALDESVYLVLRGLKLPFGCPEEDLDRKLATDEINRVRGLLQQRIEFRKPAAYILNEAYFCGLSFYVDERVLIPRSPIAELIETGFSPWLANTEVTTILDLCTGSGCVAIACALTFPGATVDAADISRDALAVAAVNVERHGVGNHLQLIESDLFSALGGRQYDLIVSNPPYVPAGEIAELPEEYRHEPQLALAAGDNGLQIVSRILEVAAAHLSERGILIVEVGDREEALNARYPKVPFTWLEFERGSGADGVFLIDAMQLRQYFPQPASGRG